LTVEERLPDVVTRVRRDMLLLRRRSAVELVGQTLRFLDVLAASTEPIAPSKRVDRAWRSFRGCTDDYAEWCRSRYGRFIESDAASRYDELAYTRAYALLRERHGPLDKRIWPVPKMVARAPAGEDPFPGMLYYTGGDADGP
jgi:hypothetical protein